jgi:formate hydrogenlyase subunit 6/NADH:ubiquinone oxidoreductase subunit I
VDVCPFEAIEMDNAHEISNDNRFQAMWYTKEQLLKSAEYFQTIKPTEAAEVDQRLAAKAAKNRPPSTPARPADSGPGRAVDRPQ